MFDDSWTPERIADYRAYLRRLYPPAPKTPRYWAAWVKCWLVRKITGYADYYPQKED